MALHPRPCQRRARRISPGPVRQLRAPLAGMLQVPEVTHLADHVYFVDRLGGPAHQVDPILKVGLFHGLTFRYQAACFQVAVDLEDGGAAVGPPFAYGAQRLSELFLGDSGWKQSKMPKVGTSKATELGDRAEEGG